jgi:hypothetical protein
MVDGSFSAESHRMLSLVSGDYWSNSRHACYIHLPGIMLVSQISQFARCNSPGSILVQVPWKSQYLHTVGKRQAGVSTWHGECRTYDLHKPVGNED